MVGPIAPPDAARLPSSVFELQLEAQLGTAQGTQAQAALQARDESSEYEGQRLEVFDRRLEIEPFFEAAMRRLWKRALALFAAGPGEQSLERTPFGPGDALFVPAAAVRRFEDFTDDFETWVVMYGPPGGEGP